MKPPPDTLRLTAPLRDVTLSAAMARGSPGRSHGSEAEAAGYERGRREGEQALREQLVLQRADLLAMQNDVFAALRQALPQVARECEAALIQLALEAAQRVVAGLPISAEMIEASVREALAQAQESAEFHVQLHPEDLALLQRVNSPLLTEGPFERMKFQSAADVTRGGCLVRTHFGLIDARRETKFGLLQKSLAS